MNRGNHIYGGFVVMTIGVLFLLGRLGIIGWSVFGTLWQLWPIILIAVGINLIFNNHFVVRILTFLALVTSIVVFGTFFPQGGQVQKTDAGWEIKPAQDTGKYAEKTYQNDDTLKSANLDITIPVGNLNITGNSDVLLKASYPENILAETLARNEGSSVQNFLYEPSVKENPVRSFGKRGVQYDYELGTKLPWAVSIQAGVTHGTMDFSDVTLKRLDIQVGAGDVDLTLGPISGNAMLSAESGTSNMEIRVPEGTEFRVTVDGGIRNVTIDGKRLSDHEGVYTTPGYDSANQRLDMKLSMGVGNIKIVRE